MTRTKPDFAAERAVGLAHMGRHPDIAGHSPGEHPETCGRCAAEANLSLNQTLASRGYRTEPGTHYAKRILVAATGRLVGEWTAGEAWQAIRDGYLPEVAA